jgi:branched-chain amino acid transport system substrate-binding protein
MKDRAQLAPKAAGLTTPNPPAAPPVVKDGTLKLGLLLPLTGAHAALGQALLNAAQLAVFEDKTAQIELLPRDTGADAAKAAAAFNAVVDQGASLVAGPLFAAQAAAVRPQAQRRTVPVLAFSNDQTVAGNGVYVLGYSPAAQISRVTAYACADNSRKFVALLPTGGYGDAVQNALQKAVHACAGASLASRRYDNGNMEQLARQLQETAVTRAQLDTLVLAEAPALLQAVAFPAALGGTQVRLLGTGLWADGAAARQVPALQGGLFALPDNANRAAFAQSYQAAYGNPPPLHADLSYDAVALASALQKNKLAPSAETLTNPSGFAGIDGIFRLHANGQVERGLAVYQLTPAGSERRDAAPAVFTASRTH